MALITVVGFPASGKSTTAQKIKAFLDARIAETGTGLTTKIVSDHSLDIGRTAYDQSSSEKPARGTLMTAVQREMSPDTVIILDSLNYIKGFRYQLYCAAREMKLRTCTVFTVATPEVCKERNSSRPTDEAYSPTTLDALINRFEEPSSMVRWDSPLITVLWSDPELPEQTLWDSVTSGVVKPPNSGTLAVTKAPSNALHTLEQTTSTMVSMLFQEMEQPGAQVTLRISSDVQQVVRLPGRPVTLAELQRIKRQFIAAHKKAITLGSTERGSMGWGEQDIAQKFAMYLAETLGLE